MFEAFRAGHKPPKVALIAEVDRRTARQAWYKGWESPAWAMRPIRELVEDEQARLRAAATEEARTEEQARAEHARRLREEREKAENDKFEQEVRELRAIRAALTNGSAILGLASKLGQALVPSVDEIASLLKRTPVKKVDELIEVLMRVARIGERATRMVDRAIEMERRRVGKPDQIVQVQSAPPQFNSSRAVELLGSEEAVKLALKDLVDGNMTKDARTILEACRVPGPSEMQ